MDVMGFNAMKSGPYSTFEKFSGFEELSVATSQYFEENFFQYFDEVRRLTKRVQRCKGMEKSFFSEFTRSYDLVNVAHIDKGDACPGMATWVETIPGKATDWYFVLPNVVLDGRPNKTARGTIIKLQHGVSIAWDGRILHHCSTVRELGSPFFSPMASSYARWKGSRASPVNNDRMTFSLMF